MSKWVTGSVSSITHWTENLFSLKVCASIPRFIAGQFTKLALEINGEKVQRAYSYVNAPSSDELEFYIVKIPEGKLTPTLSILQPKDPVLIAENATGAFILNEIPNSETLWMIATGTAIGPYLSILQEGVDLERFQHIVLIHAVRFANDLSYLPIMRQLQSRYSNKLTLQCVLSREHLPGTLTGRIPTLILSGELETAVGQRLTPDSSHVMLCGNPQMIKETRYILQEHRNMQKNLRRKPGQVTSELYW